MQASLSEFRTSPWVAKPPTLSDQSSRHGRFWRTKIALIDTGPLVALMNRAENRHAEIFNYFQNSPDRLVTTSPVLTEACYLLRDRPGASRDLLLNVDGGNFEIPYLLAQRADSIAALVLKYADVPISLADASLVDLATALDTGRTVTLDSDFQIYRWRRDQPFELLLG